MTIETDAKRGVAQHYGPRTTDGKYGAQQSTKNGVVKSAIWAFDYNDLPDAATNGLGHQIPAGAIIKSATLYVDAAFTSTSTTTDLTVGLQEADGTEIDNNGLIEADEATQTAIGTEGNVVTGAGALIGKTIGSAAGELVVAASDTDLLTGKARVVVEYVYDKD